MRDFQNKQVAVLGLGTENRPLVDFLLQRGARVTVCDQDVGLKLKWSQLPVHWRLGEDYLRNLTDFDLVFRTPGLSPNQKEIARAKTEGVEVSSVTNLFFELAPAKIIAVTGTKGKGTTSSLIYAILKENPQNRVYLLGNIGASAISVLEKLKKDDWVVLELSSFQLIDLKKSPQIAVILRIFPDHLDYHQSEQEYQKAKEPIVLFQSEDDFAVINEDCPVARRFAQLTKAQVYWFSVQKPVERGTFVRWQDKERGEIVFRAEGKEEPVLRTDEVKLLGQHNLENISAAITAAFLAQARVSEVRRVAQKFKGLEHRLEKVAEIAGVTYINDSYSTTPQTTIAALKSFSAPIILICGGRSKGGDYEALAKAIFESPVKAVLLIGEMAFKLKRLIQEVQKQKAKPIEILNLERLKLKTVVQKAVQKAQSGEVVLFSPGCASFDMFKNATQRGLEFKKAVLTLLK